MGTFIKRLFILAFVCGLLYGGSYLGARSVAGRMLGSASTDMGTRTVKFAYDSVPGIAGKQAMWVFSFSGTRLTGARNAKIYLSLTGHVIATAPRDLQSIIDQAAKSKEPS
jgi:hypothetical protein